MEFDLLVRGAVIGLSIAAPVGPIGVLCIRRTLADGRLYGLVAGLGAATADAVYGCIAAFGMSAVMGPLVHQQAALRVAGGLFLCYLGVKTALSRPAERAATTRGSGLLWAYLSTLLLTLTNPMSILAFAAIFAGLGASGTRQGLGSALTMVAGVFLGSVAWWALLSSVMHVLRSSLRPAHLQAINRVSGAIVVAFGLWSLLGA